MTEESLSGIVPEMAAITFRNLAASGDKEVGDEGRRDEGATVAKKRGHLGLDAAGDIN